MINNFLNRVLFLSLMVLAFAVSAMADGLPALDKATSFLTLSDSVVFVIMTVVGMIFRMIPTSKPLSIAYLVAAIFHQLGAFFEKLGQLGDKILPQKIAPQAPQSPPSQ